MGRCCVVTQAAWTTGSLVSPPATTPAVIAVMRANRKRDTRPSSFSDPSCTVGVCASARTIGYVSERDASAVDVVFTRQRVAVFVDGCFWHRCPDHGTAPMSNAAYWQPKLNRNVARDLAQTGQLQGAGWMVVRIWEHEPSNQAADRVLMALSSADASRRPTSD